jgi:hypothetical protein
MNTITRVILVAVLVCGSGCARTDWIEDTLVTVDVTGGWRGFSGRGGSAYSGGTIELTLQQSGAKVTGRFRGGEPGDVPIEGTVSGDRLTVSSSGSPRAFKADLQVRGDEMIGSAATSVGIMSWYLSRQP